MKRIRKNVEFELTPEIVNIGETWLTLRIKNTSDTTLRNLDVRMNSLDTLGLEVRDSSKYIPLLLPNEETTLYFRANVFFSTPVYVSLTGYRGEELMYLETPVMTIKITTQLAEIISLFATREPEPVIGDTIKCVTNIHAKDFVDDLELEVWIEAPDGGIEEVEVISIDKMGPDEINDYFSEFIPELTGIYTVRAQLFRGIKRLSSRTDYVLVKET